MNPSTTGALNTDVSNAMNQGNALQSQFNSQVPGLQANYGQAQGQANQYGQQYSNFLNNLPQSYNSDLASVGNTLGYNANTTRGLEGNLGGAAQAQASSQNIMNALPQAVNQMGNYSGATAGQVANNYANMSQNISGQAGNAVNQMNALTGALGAQTAIMGQMNTGAGNITGQQTQGYGQLYSTAVQQMQTAGQTMSQIEGLQQQQGYLTSEQVAQYNSAYQTYQQGQNMALQNQMMSQTMASPYYQQYLQNGPNGPQPSSPVANGSNGGSKPVANSSPSMTQTFSPSNIMNTIGNTNPAADLSQWGKDIGGYGNPVGAALRGAGGLLGML